MPAPAPAPDTSAAGGGSDSSGGGVPLGAIIGAAVGGGVLLLLLLALLYYKCVRRPRPAAAGGAASSSVRLAPPPAPGGGDGASGSAEAALERFRHFREAQEEELKKVSLPAFCACQAAGQSLRAALRVCRVLPGSRARLPTSGSCCSPRLAQANANRQPGTPRTPTAAVSVRC